MKVIENVDLSYFSTLKVGGTAKKLYFPENVEDVKNLIKKSKEENKKLIPIGVGSNTVFKDGILDYIFVSTKLLKNLKYWEKNNNFYIEAEAGVSFKEILNIVKNFNLEGFENLSGIPASVGGATAMNAGAFGSEIFDVIEKVIWIDKNGETLQSEKKEIDFSYRYTQFQKDGFVYKTILVLKKSKKDIKNVIKKHLLKRNEKQPLNLPTTGSTYKNPEGTYAGFLLEKTGFKGKKVGNIGFSEKHANFLVNYGNGNFKDLMKLLEIAEKTIEKEYGIKLEREIKIVG